ncbi:hypothetical protein NN561_008332 [Cricetulus griseus]
MMTVSYTHLDVYKRQVRCSGSASPNPAQKLGSLGGSCKFRARSRGLRSVSCSGGRGSSSTPAGGTGNSERALVVTGQSNPRRCSPRAAQPLHCRRQLETNDPSGPAAPAALVPWQRARRPLAPAPPERLKGQPPGHNALLALQGAPCPHALFTLFSPRGAGRWLRKHLAPHFVFFHQ